MLNPSIISPRLHLFLAEHISHPTDAEIIRVCNDHGMPRILEVMARHYMGEADKEGDTETKQELVASAKVLIGMADGMTAAGHW